MVGLRSGAPKQVKGGNDKNRRNCMRVRTILCALFILVLLGCVTTERFDQTDEPNKIKIFGATVTVTPRGDTTFRIDVSRSRSQGRGIERLRNIGMVRAAEITISSGYAYFRIHESWEYNDVLYYRTIIIRLTNNPDDIDAQEILDRLGPEVGYEQ